MSGRASDNSLAFRRRYAELLRHFIAGRLTTDQYEHQYGDLERKYGGNESTSAVFGCVWHFYDDLIPHRMTGKHRLCPEARRRVARWIVFLRSDAALADVSATALADSRPQWAHSCERVLGTVAVLSLLIGAIATLSGAVVVTLFCCFMLFAVLLGAMVCSPGVSLEPQHAEHAFSDDESDPWPFRSRAELDAALARPTYLHG
jgi:hypothetical protein